MKWLEWQIQAKKKGKGLFNLKENKLKTLKEGDYIHLEQWILRNGNIKKEIRTFSIKKWKNNNFTNFCLTSSRETRWIEAS